MKDDCTGLAQQIAYSSLLAFFPAMAFLVGTLGLFNLFDDLKSLLDPIAPNGVIDFISGLQRDSRGGTPTAGVPHRSLRRGLGSERRHDSR